MSIDDMSGRREITAERRVALADVHKGMVVTFHPRSARSRVTVVVDHTTRYEESGLAFIFGARSDRNGLTKRNARQHTYLIRPDTLIIEHRHDG
jgi:hypothetical protein